MNKQDEMFPLVEQWNASGLTRKEFAEQHGFTKSCFEYWCRKRNDMMGQQPTTPPDFVEIFRHQESKVTELSKKISAKLEIELPGGICVRFY